MQEWKEIISAYDKALAAGKRAALATVVHVEGSSYRRPGARMLVDDEGMVTGAISGGCLEGDALRKSLFAISQNASKLVVYDTGDETDMSIGIQLGCEGLIQVLFEPIDADDRDNPIELMRSAVSTRQYAVMATLFNLKEKTGTQIGTCSLLLSNGVMKNSTEDSQLGKQLMHDMLQALEKKSSSFQNYQAADGQSWVAFLELVPPPITLVVVGAGNDAIPMMNFATGLGWDVRIVDGRNTHARPDRFSSACQVLVSQPEKVLDQLPMDERTVFVMMTHNYNYDKAMLKALLPAVTPYIGMLGPKKKLMRMLDELRSEEMSITHEMLKKVFGPTGLEIGAETPEEIALSIIAEIQAVINGLNGGSLKFKESVIHDRSAISIQNKTIN
jgi:xanthine dehydrogenase accessory factor